LSVTTMGFAGSPIPLDRCGIPVPDAALEAGAVAAAARPSILPASTSLARASLRVVAGSGSSGTAGSTTGDERMASRVRAAGTMDFALPDLARATR
jgi:hypothetical protein